MFRYNLFFAEKDESFKGLNIIETSAYISLVANNPGLIHENEGDFYSKVSVSELSDVIYKALGEFEIGKEKLSKDLVILDEGFDKSSLNPEKDYLIKREHGIRIYCPGLYISEGLDRSVAYALLGFAFFDYLFCDEMKGSLQKTMEEISDLFEKVKTSI